MEGLEEDGLLLEHVLQRPRQIFEHCVQDALFLLLLLVPTACRDGLLGSGQASLTGLLQGCLLLCLFLFFLLQSILGRRGTERGMKSSQGEEKVGQCVSSTLLGSRGKLPSLEN